MPNTLLDNKKQPTYSKAEVDALLARAEGTITVNAAKVTHIDCQSVFRSGKTVVVKARITCSAIGWGNDTLLTVSGVPMPTKDFYIHLISKTGVSLSHINFGVDGKVAPWGGTADFPAGEYTIDTSYIVA
jgi:hypothetical protein